MTTNGTATTTTNEDGEYSPDTTATTVTASTSTSSNSTTAVAGAGAAATSTTAMASTSAPRDLEAIKAAARAYALSSTTTSNSTHQRKKHQPHLPYPPPTTTTTTTRRRKPPASQLVPLSSQQQQRHRFMRATAKGMQQPPSLFHHPPLAAVASGASLETTVAGGHQSRFYTTQWSASGSCIAVGSSTATKAETSSTQKSSFSSSAAAASSAAKATSAAGSGAREVSAKTTTAGKPRIIKTRPISGIFQNGGIIETTTTKPRSRAPSGVYTASMYSTAPAPSIPARPQPPPLVGPPLHWGPSKNPPRSGRDASATCAITNIPGDPGWKEYEKFVHDLSQSTNIKIDKNNTNSGEIITDFTAPHSPPQASALGISSSASSPQANSLSRKRTHNGTLASHRPSRQYSLPSKIENREETDSAGCDRTFHNMDGDVEGGNETHACTCACTESTQCTLHTRVSSSTNIAENSCPTNPNAFDAKSDYGSTSTFPQQGDRSDLAVGDLIGEDDDDVDEPDHDISEEGQDDDDHDDDDDVIVGNEDNEEDEDEEDEYYWDDNFYQELEEELGWLEEEDMEAAVATLLGVDRPHIQTPASTLCLARPTSAGYLDNPELLSSIPETQKSIGSDSILGITTNYVPDNVTNHSPSLQGEDDNHDGSASEEQGRRNQLQVEGISSPPLRESSVRSLQVTPEQTDQLRRLLAEHYQLLVQQTILAARAAQKQQKHLHQQPHEQERKQEQSSDMIIQSRAAETVDDLIDIVDAAVGMLQDLDHHRRDAIRRALQQRGMGETLQSQIPPSQLATHCSTKRTLFRNEGRSSHDPPIRGCLTRAQFTKTLQQRQLQPHFETIFHVPGLSRLNETFERIDKLCVVGESFTDDSNAVTCRNILEEAGAVVANEWLPDGQDLAENFVDIQSILGPNFQMPCTLEQRQLLKRNRNLFTAGEDNLLLRGVNLYGEKQWELLGDRFLRDRSISIIAQRYSKLCVMLYKANGIRIDKDGQLETPPKYESVDDVDESKASTLKLVPPPAVLNVHRWSMVEDLTILKAVPIFGTMWAEIAARYLPHRDRGHIRKRYLVLQRRVRKKDSGKISKRPPAQLSSATRVQPPVVPMKKSKACSSKIAPTAKSPKNPPVTQRLLPPRCSHSVDKAITRQDHEPPHTSSEHHAYYPPPTYWHPYHPPIRSTHVPSGSSPTKMINNHTIVQEARSLHDEGSRAAFEELVQESNNLTSLVDSQEYESHRECSPLCGDEESSRLSILDTYRSSTGEAKVGTNRLFSKVLQREDSIPMSRNDHSGEREDMPPPSNVAGGAVVEYSSPQKAQKRSSSNTPSRKLTTTPTALFSPNHSTMYSPGYPLKLIGSPSLTLTSFPAGENSNLVGACLAHDGPSLDSHDLKIMFGGETEHSRVVLEGRDSSTTTKLTQSIRGIFPNSPCYDDGAMLLENDLEAISALNSLSSSPVVIRDANSTATKGSLDGVSASQNRSATGNSLFAKVISKSDSLPKRKRKLHF